MWILFASILYVNTKEFIQPNFVPFNVIMVTMWHLRHQLVLQVRAR